MTLALYRLLCIIVLTPVAFVMVSFAHLFMWMSEVVSLPLQIDNHLTSSLADEEDPEE